MKKKQHFHLLLSLNTSTELIEVMWLLTSNHTCRTGTSEKKSIIPQTKILFNEITHKISSCFLKDHWRSKFRLRELKKIRKNWVERRARVDKNLNLNLRSFFFGLAFYSKWPRLIFRVGLKMICHVSWVFIFKCGKSLLR